MAREARQSPEDEAAAEQLAPESGKRARKAGGFPGALPAVTGLVAGGLAFGGAMLVGQSMAGDPFEALDAGGVQAVRMLAATDVDRWDPAFGTVLGIRAAVFKETEKKKAEARGAEDYQSFDTALTTWIVGNSSTGSKWRPGFQMFFPANDPRDETR